MIQQILAVCKKNFRRLLRSKVSALVILFGPLVMIMLGGIAFNSSKLNGIVIGVYADTTDSVTSSVISLMKAQSFEIKTYAKKEQCTQAVKDADIHLCVAFLKKSGKHQLEFSADYTRMNLVYSLLTILNSGLESESQKISLEMTGELLSQIKSTAAHLKESSKQLSEFEEQMSTLTVQIQQMRSGIAALDIPVINSSVKSYMDDLAQGQKDADVLQKNVNRDIDLYQTNLDTIQKQLAQYEKDIVIWQKDISGVKGNLTKSYTTLGCSVSADFFGNQSVLLSQSIIDSTEPACALISSGIKEINRRQQIIDDSQKQVNAVQDEVTNAQNSLTSAKKTVNNVSNSFDTKSAELSVALNQAQRSIDETSIKLDNARKLRSQFVTQFDEVQIQLDEGLQKLGLFSASLDQTLQNYSNLTIITPQAIVNPIDTKINSVQKTENVLQSLFPSLLVLIVTFTGVMLGATLILKEKVSQAYFRNFILPLHPIIFIVGTYLTALVIVVVQIIFMAIIGAAFFQINLLPNMGYFLLSIPLICSIFILFGMIIGYIFKTEETAILASVSLSCILFLFSSTIIPLEKMQEGIGVIAKASPFVLSQEILRQILIFGQGFASTVTELLLMHAYFVIFFIAVIYAQMTEKERFE
jgi:ABC-type multidrug transport system permease subunit